MKLSFAFLTNPFIPLSVSFAQDPIFYQNSCEFSREELKEEIICA